MSTSPLSRLPCCYFSVEGTVLEGLKGWLFLSMHNIYAHRLEGNGVLCVFTGHRRLYLKQMGPVH